MGVRGESVGNFPRIFWKFPIISPEFPGSPGTSTWSCATAKKIMYDLYQNNPTIVSDSPVELSGIYA